METKIASYQEPGVRLQLIFISPSLEETRKQVMEYYSTGKKSAFKTSYYQIRRNRKVLCNLKWETPARQKFNALIQQEILQTKRDL